MPNDRFVYTRLVAAATGDPFDRHVFACAIAAAAADANGDRPLTEGLGLARAALADLFAAYFPHARGLIEGPSAGSGPGDDALEEPDLRRLLLAHRRAGTIAEDWLARIIARRSLGANHLWQDMGLSNRGEVSALLDRHFHGLAAANSGNMKWKKFFYRQLCLQEDVLVCKSPNCEVCDDFAQCFGDELPVIAVSGSRQTARAV